MTPKQHLVTHSENASVREADCASAAASAPDPHPCPSQNFLNTSSCPEIQGFLHVKELGRKSWKKMYLCLRRSGLYCSTKGSSKVTFATWPHPGRQGRRVGGASFHSG